MTTHTDRITLITNAHPDLDADTARMLLMAKSYVATRIAGVKPKELDSVMEEFTEMLCDWETQQVLDLAGEVGAGIGYPVTGQQTQ